MSTKNISFTPSNSAVVRVDHPTAVDRSTPRLISPDSPCWKFDGRFWLAGDILADHDRRGQEHRLQRNDQRQHRPPRPLAKPAATATRLLKIQESVAAARRSALGENPCAQSSRASLTSVNDME